MFTFVCAVFAEALRRSAGKYQVIPMKYAKSVADICGDDKSTQTTAEKNNKSWLVKFPDYNDYNCNHQQFDEFRKL